MGVAPHTSMSPSDRSPGGRPRVPPFFRCCGNAAAGVIIRQVAVDWGAGRYETTAAELAPAAELVVERSGVGAGDDVLDVACGTGNAALGAAARGARVVGVDGAARLLAVARER